MDTPAPTLEALDRRRALQWFGLAFGSLLLAGIFALLLVLGRMPPLSLLFTDPGFFRRSLVVHVDLAMVLWFYAFTAALFVLIPSRGAPNTIGRHAVLLAGIGVALLMAAATIPGVAPVLANYVPVLDHPLFLVGLLAIGLALAFTLLDLRLLPRHEARRATGAYRLPVAAIPLLRCSAIAILLALMTFAASWTVMPQGLSPAAYYEALMWGGGHVLQFASVSAMLAVWVVLLTPVLGQEPLSRRTAALLGALLVTPLFGAPLLALQGTTTLAYRLGFTRLMQFGIAPVVLVFLGLCVAALGRAHRAGVLPRGPSGNLLGFATSALLTLVGFALGASIHGSNTVVPAHYHASIGGVTVALMAVSYPLLEGLGLPSLAGRSRALMPWQPVILGLGQVIFAAGFALAGAHGMQRKSYASEQQIRTTAEYVGLGIMGTGGFLAVAGGVLFLVLVGAIWRRHLFAVTRKTLGREVLHAGQ